MSGYVHSLPCRAADWDQLMVKSIRPIQLITTARPLIGCASIRSRFGSQTGYEFLILACERE